MDRAALDVAHELGFHCGGWCPKGRASEDGRISTRYPLFQTSSALETESIELNVREADGTLVLSVGEALGAVALAIEFAAKHQKTSLVIDLQAPVQKEVVTDWIQSRQIAQLNIVGPPASEHPQIYRMASAYLKNVFDAEG